MCRVLAHTSITMDTIIVVYELLQEGLILLKHLVTHVRNVVEERLILHLEHKHHKKSLVVLSGAATLASSKGGGPRLLGNKLLVLNTDKTPAWSCLKLHNTKHHPHILKQDKCRTVLCSKCKFQKMKT